MTIFVTNAGLQILARVTWRRAAVLLTMRHHVVWLPKRPLK